MYNFNACNSELGEGVIQHHKRDKDFVLYLWKFSTVFGKVKCIRYLHDSYHISSSDILMI